MTSKAALPLLRRSSLTDDALKRQASSSSSSAPSTGPPSLLRRLSSFSRSDKKSTSGSVASASAASSLSRRASLRKRISGIKHLSETPYRFRFTLTIEAVERLACSEHVVVVWERANEMVSTEPRMVDRASQRVSFDSFQMARDITLFRSGKEESSSAKFEEKIFKLAVRIGSKEGRTLGKIHLNFADYAAVPSGSRKLAANLSNGASLVFTVESTFLKMGKKPQGFGGSQAGSDAGSTFGDGDDDFSDLGLSDEDDDVPPKSIDVAPRVVKSSPAVANGDMDGLREQNEMLRKRVDELEKKNAVLMKTVAQDSEFKNALKGTAAPGKGLSDGDAEKLRSQIASLNDLLAREPAFNDVVRELKDVKTRLALLSMEKEEIYLEMIQAKAKLAKLQGKKKKPSKQVNI